MREFMWLAASYSAASTAPLNVCTHSDILSPFACRLLRARVRRLLCQLAQGCRGALHGDALMIEPQPVQAAEFLATTGAPRTAVNARGQHDSVPGVAVADGGIDEHDAAVRRA